MLNTQVDQSDSTFDVLPMSMSIEKVLTEDQSLADVRTALDKGSGSILLDAAQWLELCDVDCQSELIKLGNRLGKVVQRGKTESPIWRVESKPDKAMPSFSEQSNDAPFHTDASYYPAPMKYLIFLSITPASQGGENLILSHRRLLDSLREKENGREIISILSQSEFPFSMSPSFHVDSSKELPLEVAPVLSDDSIRFQIKAIRNGFHRKPELMSTKKVYAIEQLESHLAGFMKNRGEKLKAGQMLIVNNWRALHARKAFGNEKRLLFRASVEAELE
ncbi:TauD/TfdA family dioxygenase [Marinomonas mediterranea]|jgi:Probable taurine catabolism dioxygenase|uniref:TauD/TfdA-like domain-containing protein n=1 Tax=Marinomonas mediterranea (strain ATCC 700492 / JCM 21426 / NBRC 103028 / MMB-1) TaxID=717774 RepID=F2JW51_MARM1|nr:TauD/TfdA family dioxygenase [Marinomonas mediterranea]ADZ89439.1 hypothetical protein Marme_0135 [Marinomonas mediterranea MMB-1]WCN15692.1 hypothetical protein GV053_00665 [Marinomonas mediterranea MMB-1]